MIFLTRLFFVFIGFISLSTIDNLQFINDAFAQSGQFETSYKVSYEVSQDSNTQVTQNITLKNKTPNYYADSFELKIGSTKIEDVLASNEVGQMEVSSKFENNVTSINVKFNQRVIGVDKTNQFTILYKSRDLASKSGQIREVSIPRLASNADILEYLAKVSVPASFGELSSGVPTPKNSSKVAGRVEYTFDKDQLFASGVSMSFGRHQVFAYNLSYYIENNSLTNRLQEITLPPDNNYQKVVLANIEPKPNDLVVDDDGNFIAKYKLAPRQVLDIKATGYVEIFAKPFRKIYKELSNYEREIYTQPQRYWEIDNTFIRDKAQELKTAQKIYDFVSNFLSYNEKRLSEPVVQRKGAASAIISPRNSICAEFTDLFIAIARAAKIPAREVEGYAYTQNERLKPLSLNINKGDILHAWPEYWDENLGWVQIDPTWAATSGGLDYFNSSDFNHITLVQRGYNSSYPIPAGGYKRVGTLDKKSVDIFFAEELPESSSIPELGLVAPEKVLSGSPIKVRVLVKNSGTSSIINGHLNLSTNRLKSQEAIYGPQKETLVRITRQIAILPPSSTLEFTFDLQTSGFIQGFNDVLTLSFADSQIAKPIEVLPVYKVFLIGEFIISILLATLIIIIGLLIHIKIKINKQKLKPRLK